MSTQTVPTQGGRALTATEQLVAGMVEEVLKRQGIGVTDDFFDVGGTSMDLIRLFVNLNERLNLTLDGSVLGEEATIAKLAACVDAARG